MKKLEKKKLQDFNHKIKELNELLIDNWDFLSERSREEAANFQALAEIMHNEVVLEIKVEEYEKKLEKNSFKINKLEKYVEELTKSNLWLQKEIKEESETHLGAARIAGEWAEKKFLTDIEKLKTDINRERELAQGFFERLAEKIIEADKWHELSEDNYEKLQKEIKRSKGKDETIKKLNDELYLTNKPLPKIPNKFIKLKSKAKTKFQHLIEKTKQQSQKLFARIEVKTK